MHTSLKLLLVALALALAPAAQAAVVTGTAALESSQEVPPIASESFGTATFQYDTVANKITNLSLTVIGVGLSDLFDTSPTAGPVHIHNAPLGANGPIVLPLGPTSGPNTYFEGPTVEPGDRPSFTLIASDLMAADPSAFEAALFAGELYFNIHTLDFNGGEVRGQIAVTPIPGAVAMFAPALAGLVWLRRRRANAEA